MSTYPANLCPDKPVSSREGSSEDGNTAQWQTVESKNTKKQTWQQAEFERQSNALKIDSKQPQQIIGKLFSCALSTLNAFAEAEITAVKWKNKTRPRVMATLDGVKVDLLYDTGAMSSCLTMYTYDKCFKHNPIDTTSYFEARAAGNFDLNVIGTVNFKLQVKDNTLDHEFFICNGVNDDIMSVRLANQVQLSYDATNQTIWSIVPIENSIVVHHRTLLPLQSTAIIST